MDPMECTAGLNVRNGVCRVYPLCGVPFAGLVLGNRANSRTANLSAFWIDAFAHLCDAALAGAQRTGRVHGQRDQYSGLDDGWIPADFAVVLAAKLGAGGGRAASGADDRHEKSGEGVVIVTGKQIGRAHV